MRRKLFIGLVITIIVMGLAPPATAYEDSLKAYWNFDDGSGSTAEDLAGNHDGTVNGATWTTSGKLSGALSFDGNDHVAIAGFDALTTNTYTWSFWIYDQSTNLNAFRRWITTTTGGVGSNSVMIREAGDNIQIYPYRDPGPGISNGVSWIGSWHMLTLVSGGSYTKVYMDNNSTAIIEEPVSVIPEHNLYIGGYYMGGEYFKGKMDDIAMWNRALGANEINMIYDIGVEKFEGLITGLHYTPAQISQLWEVYAQQLTDVAIGQIVWSYTSDPFTGHGMGDLWSENGKLFIKLGSGLEGTPEPVTVLSFIAGMAMLGLKRLLKRSK